MTITGKQVRQLRSMANQLETILTVGKNGVLDTTVDAAASALEAHELIKGSVQADCGITAREAGEALAERLNASLVQVIGRRFVLYRRSSRKDVKHIELVK